MSSDQPKQGLFSSLSLGRASRPAKATSSTDQPLAHPLLGASTSSLNINEASTSGSSSNGASAPDHHPSAPSHSRQNSASGSRSVSATTDILNVPYKPRQRGSHTQGANSVSSMSSTAGIHTTTSPSFPPSVTTSPVTPTAAPTTSTSTSATFALPPSATATAETAFAVDTMVPAVGGSPSTSSASATSRLQLQSLKAAAQKVGLGNGSMGMQLVDTIFEKSQAGRGKAEGVEWVELLKLISAGKAVLLLPTTPVSSLPITTQVLRDHVAFLSSSIPQSASASHVDAASIRSEGANGSATSIVTLSGLVGTLRGSTVVFESTLPTDSSLSAAIRDPLTRTATLSALRPTTLPSAAQHFPSFTLSTETTLLPFPPINKSTTPVGGHETKDQPKPSGGKLGRINPFMSLFGGSQAASPALGSSPAAQSDSIPSSPSKASFGTLSPERPRSPVHAASPSQLLSSPKPVSMATLVTDQAETASIRSDITSRDRDPEGYHILAYTVSKPIRAGDVGKSIHKSLKTSIREELHRLPDKVVEKVFRLVVAGACPTYHPTTDKPDPSLTLDYADPTLTGEKLQEVLEGIYDDLILHFRADSSHLFAENSEYSSIRRKASWTRKGMPAEMLGDKAENESEGAKKERKEKLRREKEAMVEREATDGTERVEAVVCRLLYNRLFSPLESDDARHDEALSSRIAALNMLDLSLDHLGLITRPDDAPPEEDGLIARGLADIVDRIGEELQKLSAPNCLTPKEKGDVLMQAHKLVVDGLADLPPISLRPEGEQYKPPSRSPSPSPRATPAVEQPASAPDVPKVPSSTSLSDVTPAASKDAPPTAPSAALAMRRSSSSGSTSLSTSPASNDPLSSIAEVVERTPQGLQATSPTQVPQLVLPDSNTEASQIEQAMSDSVITLPARDSPTTENGEAAASTEKTASRRQATSGADLILPIIIFAVVKSNPPQLASQLMYLRRYRSAICLTGEASYAIVNLTAVVEFLEHVELSQLGLGDESDKVISVEDLSPIGLNYLDETNADAASIASASSRLRGRVFQVGELAGSAADSANKVLTGVVDSSWTALRGLISTPNQNPPEDDASVPPPSGDNRPGMRPRQASSFFLASVTASVATIAAAAASRSRSRANSRASAIMSQPKEEHTWKGNEEMVEVVSRPASVRERDRQSIYPSDDDDAHSDNDNGDGGDLPSIGVRHERSKSDTRSIYSVASAVSRVKSRDADSIKESSRKDAEKEKEREDAKERVSISDRLASIGVLGRIGGQETPTGREAGIGESPQGKSAGGLFAGITSSARSASASGAGHARRLSLLSGREASPAGSNASLPTVSPASGLAGVDIEPPIEQFMTCDVGDIKLSEIGVLLRDYRRLGGIVNALKAKGGGTVGAQPDVA